VTAHFNREGIIHGSGYLHIVNNVEIMLAVFALFGSDHHDPELLCEIGHAPHLIPLCSWF